MKYSVELEFKVWGINGNKTIHRRQELHTYVKNFLMLTNAAFKVSTSTVKDTGNVSRAASAKHAVSWSKGYNVPYTITFGGSGGWAPNAPEADATYGIIVGTSDIAVTVDDYNLKAKIAHGNAAGQLYHYGTTLPDPVDVGGNKIQQELGRVFINNSGAEITVKEIGLVVKTNVDNYLVLIIRDVITPVPVPNGGTLEVSIFITTTA
jgi:hypothetical protein